MFYALMGYAQAKIEWRLRAIRSLLAGERGQGTVEYVGLILLVSLLMVGMVAAMKGFNRSLSKTSVANRHDGIGNSPSRPRCFQATPQCNLAVARLDATVPRSPHGTGTPATSARAACSCGSDRWAGQLASDSHNMKVFPHG